jgi:hypothetical protein
MRLIDGEALYKQIAESEEKARDMFLDTSSSLPCPTYINPAYTRYNERLNERTRLKHMIADAPTIDAVQVVRCKYCKWWDREDEKNGYCSEMGLCEVNENHYCGWGKRNETDNIR